MPRRPRAIVEFELCFVAALVLAVGNLAVNWRLFFDSPDDVLMDQVHPWVGPVMIGGVYVIWALLGYFTARRAVATAKWIVVAGTALTTGIGLVSIWNFDLRPGVAGVIQIIVEVLGLVAVARLFDPAARRWFRGEREAADVADDFT